MHTPSRSARRRAAPRRHDLAVAVLQQRADHERFRIALAGGSMRMTELAEALLFTAGGATRIVDRMVRAGLLDRARVDATGGRPGW